jgi:Xaa-Pro aminopeptidase
MREREVYQTMLNGLSVAGGETFLAITSGPGSYDLVSKPPNGRVLENGDMVWMDAGCRVAGYWSDYSRAGVAGAPSHLQELAQEKVHQITTAAIQQIRPGVRCSEIARFCLDRLAELPFATTSSIAARAGRIGHGIGLNMTEPPHLGLHDDTPLRAGMIVSVEPGVATEYGTFHVEEDIVVREEGCELLSTSPRSLAKLA